MAVNINVPSQVKTYANLAAFPATGELKTIYIAEDNNKTYRWTGSVYVEISASAAAAVWGNITGTLSSQTDLQSALNAKQNTLTLTTTGTSGAATLVGSTLNIPQYSGGASGITIGTTAITSGTVGCILFEGTGNVVQQLSTLALLNDELVMGGNIALANNSMVVNTKIRGINGLSVADLSNTTRHLFSNSSSGFSFIGRGGGSLGINTDTNAGFRLDVNGTARVQGNAQFGTGFYWDNTNGRVGIGTSTPSHAITIENASQPSVRLVDTTNAAYLDLNIGNFDATISSNGRIYINSTTTFSANATNVGVGIANPINAKFQVVGTVLFSSGNVMMNSTSGNTLIGTTTDVASAQLNVESTTKGFLPPRMTTTQRNAIASPAAGLIVYDNTDNKHYGYNGTTWNAFY